MQEGERKGGEGANIGWSNRREYEIARKMEGKSGEE